MNLANLAKVTTLFVFDIHTTGGSSCHLFPQSFINLHSMCLTQHLMNKCASGGETAGHYTVTPAAEPSRLSQ